MGRKHRATGWGLLALAVAAPAVIVTVGALRAHTDAEFNRWGVWATVMAVPLAALGIVLMLADKIRNPADDKQVNTAEAADQLAAVVLAQIQAERSRLIGAGEPGDQAANVRFVKSSGRFREVGGASTGDLESVLEYYLSLSPGRLVVLGEPGAGKTVLAMELAIRLLESRQEGSATPVPVLVSAAASTTSDSWDTWLAGHLALRFGISAAAAASLIQNDRVLPMIDGVDEIDLDGGTSRARRYLSRHSTPRCAAGGGPRLC